MISPITNVPALRYDRPKGGGEARAADRSEGITSNYVVQPAEKSTDEEARPSHERRRTTRHNTGFLTHLIAVNENVEDMRARRRVTPEIGAASYVAPTLIERLSVTGDRLLVSA